MARPAGSNLHAHRRRIDALYLADETQCVHSLIEAARNTPEMSERISVRAERLVHAVREHAEPKGGVQNFLRQYDLSSEEGVVLMCLAEALLRIPDAETADRLIGDKLSSGRWEEHLGESPSLFVNASTWGLMLTGRLVRMGREAVHDPGVFVARLVTRLGEPAIRLAMRHAMRIMGRQFVMGDTIDEALRRAATGENDRYRYSFDMLGESALTRDDAERYLEAYRSAIKTIAARVETGRDLIASSSISVKLSALHPRYEIAQRARVLRELVPRVRALAEIAASASIALTIDAEEADRLDLSLEVFETAYRSPTLDGWNGFGLAVQAYQKRAVAVIDWVAALGEIVGRRIPVRLVKGAYWDLEIKRAQLRGLDGYPVFTRKQSTDISYLACMRRLFASDAVYPQFATHNAYTVAAVIESAPADRPFELQRLHGMGEELYESLAMEPGDRFPVRVYAPVGSHEDLLPYLVRRLLENGANTSFVNRITDERVSLESIVADPVERASVLREIPHPAIPLPLSLYGNERRNSLGPNLSDRAEIDRLISDLSGAMTIARAAQPVVSGQRIAGVPRAVTSPADRGKIVGTVVDADDAAVRRAVSAAAASQRAWDAVPARRRKEILDRASDLFETHAIELMALCVQEAGKTIPDSVAELREAVDSLRYYGARAEADFGAANVLSGPTGERNTLELHGRGVFACISPWNFPLAIFTGQIAAALASGNTVLAKPAEQTPLIAARAVELLLEAGVPAEALHLLPGDGPTVGGALVGNPRVSGVVFTGSSETARSINRSLATRGDAVPVLIAETGGQNTMIVDSSALPEQVVQDVLVSAFNSAGQRCSALRVLFVQNEIADRVIETLCGAMDELIIGDPARIETDVGPVIDADAVGLLEEHRRFLQAHGTVLRRLPVPEACAAGTFFGPMAVEIGDLGLLTHEVFGPVLHVIRYAAHDIDRVVDAINATGYGLTFGVHSRIDGFSRAVAARVKAGNIYVNRNMIGAVVGVQPFGGEGLSGTGPKTGGPHYLQRFAVERAISENTAAVGGNTRLLALGEE